MSSLQVEIAEGGPRISRIVAGAMNLARWNIGGDRVLGWIESCIEMGVTTFDHADIYGGYACEAIFGSALGSSPSLRDKMQLVTKCGIKLVSENRPAHRIKYYDTSRAHILESVENSLRALRTDYIDLLLIHRPDPLMYADEVAGAFTELREAGKALHFGVSNFLPWQFELLASRLGFPLVTNQLELSALNMGALHDGTIDLCQKLRISPMAWSPFAGGQIFSSESEQAARVREALEMTGRELGSFSIDQVALAWLLTHPSKVIPVLGTGSLERIRSAVALVDMRLSREQWFAIWTASAGRRVP